MSNEIQINHNDGSFLTQISQNNDNFLANQAKYMAEIRRDQPTAFVFLIDQSGSMNSHNKANICADAINYLLNETINISTKEGGLRNYIDIALIGYGKEKESNFLLNDGFMTIQNLSQKFVRTEKTTIIKKVRNTELKEEKEIKIWVEPLASGATPMGNAFEKTYQVLKNWIDTHPDSFPPVVINISDGQPTDAKDEEMLEKALKIKNLQTKDGNILLFNCHLGQNENDGVIFPQNRNELPQNDKYATLMYDMSSSLPPQFYKKVSQVKNQDIDETKQIVAMSYNADSTYFLGLLEVGTRTQMTAIAQKK